MPQNSKAWLTKSEIAEVVTGEYWSAGSLSPLNIPRSVAEDIATRIATASRDKARRLQEQDPMSRLGTSATESAKAFQDLQEMGTSAPLDAEQIRKDADILASFHGAPREPWYKRLWNFLVSPFRATSEFGGLVKEYQDTGVWGHDDHQDIVSTKALRDLFREPWYKHLWSWLRGTK